MNCTVCAYWARIPMGDALHHDNCPVGKAVKEIIAGWHQAEALAMQDAQVEQTEEAYKAGLDNFLTEKICAAVDSMYNPTRR